MPNVCRNPDCPDFDGEGGEYRDDVVVCPRCGGALVAADGVRDGLGSPSGAPGGRDGETEVELVELCVAADQTEAVLIESVLTSAGIRYLMTDPVDAGFGGWGRIIVGPGSFVGRARFVVAADDLEEARALIAPSDGSSDGRG